MRHDIPADALNSRVERCIDEYVRLYRDRDILRDHWFGGLSFKELADKYHLSPEAVKKIIYGIGDNVLIRATKE